MANYQLRSGSNVLVDVRSSSNLDGSRRRSLRGTIFPTLGATIVQLMETSVVGDEVVEWRIRLADGSQRGILQSASDGTFGHELILVSPYYGAINVTPTPGREGYEETPYEPRGTGYDVTMRFVRLD